MIRVLRSELLRTMLLRSSWVSIAGAVAGSLTLSTYSIDFWAIFAGLGAFALAVMPTAGHYQHRTALLLMLGEPRRMQVLIGQCLSAIIVGEATTFLGGLGIIAGGGESTQLVATFTVVPLIAIFGVALATLVRHTTWLLVGAFGWLVIVETLLLDGRQKLPFTTFFRACTGSRPDELYFLGWTLLALAAGIWAIRRDLTASA